MCFSLTMGDRTRPKLPVAAWSREGASDRSDYGGTPAETMPLIQSQLDAEAMAIEAHGGPTVLKDLEYLLSRLNWL